MNQALVIFIYYLDNKTNINLIYVTISSLNISNSKLSLKCISHLTRHMCAVFVTMFVPYSSFDHTCTDFGTMQLSY